jgi:transcriptional regulator with XRE-family HTH domain
MVVRALSLLAAAREAAGYTQESLAVALKVERTTIGRWERDVQSPQPWQRRGLADALRVSLGELDDMLRGTAKRAVATTGAVAASSDVVAGTPISRDSHDHAPVTDLDVIHAAIPRLRRALDRLDMPSDGPTRTPVDLQGEVVRASDDRLQSRYGSLARRLPDLIAELARAGQLGEAANRRHAAALLTLALRAADGVAFKFGYLDLSARLIDLMRSAAQLAEDPLLVATVAYVRTETYFASGDLDTAARALELAADSLPVLGTVSSWAAFGALHMRAAVVAGRAGRPDRAADHLREARSATTAVPEGVYQGTAFGPPRCASTSSPSPSSYGIPSALNEPRLGIRPTNSLPSVVLTTSSTSPAPNSRSADTKTPTCVSKPRVGPHPSTPASTRRSASPSRRCCAPTPPRAPDWSTSPRGLALADPCCSARDQQIRQVTQGVDDPVRVASHQRVVGPEVTPRAASDQRGAEPRCLRRYDVVVAVIAHVHRLLRSPVGHHLDDAGEELG